MAKAIGRNEPFSGEVIRLYEAEINSPGADARAALAKVFARSEAYIQFGVDSGTKPDAQDFTSEERTLIERYRAADPRWQLSLRTLAAIATEVPPTGPNAASPQYDAVVRHRTSGEQSGRQDHRRSRHVRKS